MKIIQPSRALVRRSTTRVVGWLASYKMGCLIPWESQIERGFFRWMEVDPSIKAYAAQPATFVWNDTRYTPDAFIRRGTNEFYVEVKPDTFLQPNEDLNRFRELQTRLKSETIELKLVTEKAIQRSALITNVNVLSRQLRWPHDQYLLDLLLNLLATGPRKLGSLVEQLPHPATDMSILRFVARGHLLADITKPITADTIISLH